jgi:APA family basic amino acid/polyamine antiporter
MADSSPGDRDQAAPALRRELGRWDLTAIGINQVIGAAVFLMPSQVAREIGAWGPLAFLLAGVASLLVALCFAEVGSRFEGTGGPYLYTRAAFGRLAAFEIGWMQWFTRASSQAAVSHGLALALGFYWPRLSYGSGRLAFIVVITLVLTVINLRGIRQSAWVVNALTVSKLLPLSLFIIVGLFFIVPLRLVPAGGVTIGQASAAALLLTYVFGGYDVISVPAGEALNPRRHIPVAFVTTILVVTVVMTLAQIVATGTLVDLAASQTPVADAAYFVAGSVAALTVGIGSVASMTGNIAGQVLTGPRMLYALAENGELPRPFARIHPNYRTPSFAIVFSSTVALGLALSGSFAVLASVSAVARLITYLGVCASTLVLRGERFRQAVHAAEFVIPGGPVVPILAILVSLGILAGASRGQLFSGAVALAAGGVLFLLNSQVGRMTRGGKR